MLSIRGKLVLMLVSALVTAGVVASVATYYTSDMALPEGFDAEVYSVVAQIPAGRVTTYGQIARLIGMPGYARRVGHALAAAPAGLPCHRVVNSAGRTAPHWTEQRPMLEAEGVRFRKNGCVDLTRSGWKEVTL